MAKTQILIATDLSERSDRAIHRGFLLAGQLGADITIVSVVDDALPDALADDLLEKARTTLEHVAAERGHGIAHKIQVEKGDPVARLLELVNADGVDLVIVGRHRPRKLFDGLRRTTVESLLAKSLKPVLMVVEPVLGEYRKVLVPVAFSSACRRAVRQAHLIAPSAEFRIFHAWAAPFETYGGGEGSDYVRAVEREISEEAKTWSQGLPSALQMPELFHENVGACLQREIAGMSPDLLAIGVNTRSASFTGLGSFTSDLLRDPPTDLLMSRGI